MLHEEVEKYINLSGDKEAWQNTSVSRIGGYLDGYDKGLEVLDKIRAQFKSHLRGVEITLEVLVENDPLRPKLEGAKDTLEECLEIIDKYKPESEEEE